MISHHDIKLAVSEKGETPQSIFQRTIDMDIELAISHGSHVSFLAPIITGKEVVFDGGVYAVNVDRYPQEHRFY